MIDPPIWTAMDEYFVKMMIPVDPVLDAAMDASHKAGLPPISVSPTQGKFLQLLARMSRAKTILEVGTLGGYSTIWLARALPKGGKVVTLEFDPMHADVAKANFARAGLSDSIDLRLGKAIDHLPKLPSEFPSGFDFIFIDADKPSTPEYFTWALKLSHPGTVIIVDNVVRKGEVSNASSDDLDVQGIQRFMALLAAEPRVSASALQTVGQKGYDGFAVAIVNG